MIEHMKTNFKEHLSLLSSKYNNLKKNTTESDATKFLYITNLPHAANEQMLHSRFGQFGKVSSINIIPSTSAAIIEYGTNDGYTRLLSTSQLYPINLLKNSLKVTLMYSDTAASCSL
jgi:hypothetical protein